MPVHSSKDTFTYERFFGLREKPFSLASDPRFLYPSTSHAIAFDELLAGIRRREGLLVLTGDIGTGKTTLCRAVLRHLDRKTFSAFVPDPFASREDLLKMLLIEFGVLSIQDLANGPLKTASRTELNYLLAGFLDSLAPLEAFVVMFIDEAQNMSLPMIEEVRILSDTYGQTGQLQVVFVGQLELHQKLKLPEMRQVDQRVCAYCKLEPLSADAVSAYVHHRLEVAGGSPDRVMFSPEIFGRLHQASGGVPRVINRICDRALHLAYLRHAAAVDRQILDAALVDVGHIDAAPAAPAVVLPPAAALEPAAAAALATVESVQPELPATRQETFNDSIDAWLTRAERNPKLDLPRDVFEVPRDAFPSETLARETLPGATFTPESFTPDVSASATFTLSLDKVAETAAKVADAPRQTVRPVIGWRSRDHELRSQTYMQKLGRRWAQRLAIAAAILIAVNGVMVGASYLPTDLVVGTVDIPEVAPPAPTVQALTVPAMPEPEAAPALSSVETPASNVEEQAQPRPATTTATGGRFHVAVGLFTGQERATRLVAELTQAGLPAFQRRVKMSGDRMVQQVLLGPYAGRAEAQADLDRLHRTSGFEDANVIEFGSTGADE